MTNIRWHFNPFTHWKKTTGIVAILIAMFGANTNASGFPLSMQSTSSKPQSPQLKMCHRP
ncbi:MAG: hypothetical protein IPP22_09225 [Nitrosomonas sp.]|nr:hypothetical protein [Nitrosomonas sp.]